MSENIKQIYPGVYTTKYAWNHARFGRLIKRRSKHMYNAMLFLKSMLEIESNVWMMYKPLRQSANLSTFGLLTPDGTILIDPRFSLAKNIETLAHEMIHVKQKDRGDLEYVKNEVGQIIGIIWKDVFHDFNDPVALSKTSLEDYQNLPWEQEVLKFEQFFYELTMAHIGFPVKNSLVNGNQTMYNVPLYDQ